MFCKNCGNQIDDNAMFCTYCGKPVKAASNEMNQQASPDNTAGSGSPKIPNRITVNNLPASQKNPSEFRDFTPPVKKKMSPMAVTAIILGSIAFLAIIAVAVIMGLRKYNSDNQETVVVNDKDDNDNSHKTDENIVSTVSDSEKTDKGSTSDAAEKKDKAENQASETSAEGVKADKITIKAAYKAYLNILSDHKDKIRNYNWQMGYEATENYPVSFKDLNNDGIEEMIFLEAESLYEASLYIYSYEKEKMVNSYTYQNLDVEVAGGTDYYLADLKDSEELILFRQMSDEGTDIVYTILGLDNFGKYVSVDEFERSSYPNEDYSDTVVTCKRNGAEIEASEFDTLIKEKLDNIDMLLTHSAPEALDEIIVKNRCSYMTLEEAVSKLSKELDDVDVEALFKVSLPVSNDIYFTFASGAGGWSTWLILDGDGNFSGNYHDTDMGSTGEGYPNGTIYYSNFNGSFKNITQVDRYTYKMELDHYNTDQEIGTDELFEETHYIYTEPYGIDGGSTFYLYTPGKPISELSESFLSWSYGVIGDISGNTTLDTYALYNEETGEAFFVENTDDLQ